MKFSLSVLSVIAIACAGGVLLAPSCAVPPSSSGDSPDETVDATSTADGADMAIGVPGSETPFGPGLGQFARVVPSDIGGVRVDLAFFSISEDFPPVLCERYEDSCLIPDRYVPILQLHVPEDVRPPFGTTFESDLQGLGFTWHHAEIATNLESDCLKTDSGGWQCPSTWVKQSLSTESADLEINVAELEPWPGGRVNLAVSVRRFELQSASGTLNYCCGNMNYRTEGELDSELWVSVDEMSGWPGSVSCGYGSLEEVPRESCPASR